MTDGVHDNFDPQLLGFEPNEIGHKATTWTDLTEEDLVKTKSIYASEFLEKMIQTEESLSTLNKENKHKEETRTNQEEQNTKEKQTDPEGQEISSKGKEKEHLFSDHPNRETGEVESIAKRITKTIIDYCVKTTLSSRQFMENYPKRRTPEDRRVYPGKMDHTTCVCFEIR